MVIFMVNIHAFSKPKMRRTFVVSLMVILAIILALPNVSYARSNTQWPEGIDGYKYTPAEKPKSGAWPYRIYIKRNSSSITL